MDERGIFAQVLYPNVAGFGAGQFLKAQDPDLMYELVRAYNDFLVDFSSTDSDRYIPVMAVPFWDVDLSVREIHRAAEIGHKGIVFGGYPEYFGEPDITDRHWEPIWSTAEEMGLAINFHVASGDTTNLFDGHLENGEHANFASNGVSYFLGNGRVIAKVICAGVCHRHPRLKFVSVESGIGWLPYFCHALDWQWQQSGAHLEHPDYLLPSEYFKRQFYGCFWSEVETALSAIELMGSSNFMFETDFPHPTSLEPGPASIAPDPKTHINEFFSRMKRRDAEAILHDNAAAVYGLTV